MPAGFLRHAKHLHLAPVKSPLSAHQHLFFFLQAGFPSCCPTNSVIAHCLSDVVDPKKVKPSVFAGWHEAEYPAHKTLHQTRY